MDESFLNDIVSVAKDIYTFVTNIYLMKKTPISLICVGQSPAYFALAMRHIREYRAEAVEVLVLPYSKHGVAGNITLEHKLYKQRLSEAGVHLRNDVFVLDYIVSGNGILSFKKTLALCFPEAKISLISINADNCCHKVPVYKQFTMRNLKYLLDNSDRIVQHYSPYGFAKEQIICEFINLHNNVLATSIVATAIISVN